jgi:hypothetical protein
MVPEWFYEVMGERVGPVSSAQLRDLARQGAISVDTPISNAPDGPWVSADRVPGLQFFAPCASIAQMNSMPSTRALECEITSDSLVLEGQGKTLFVVGGCAKIVTEGSLFAAKWEKTILINNITSVEIKEPGFTPGYIQFAIAGGVVRDRSSSITGGAVDAASDENSVLFFGDVALHSAHHIKAYIEEYHHATQEAQTVRPPSPADQIRELKSLLDEGLITAEEFALKRKQILGV